MELSTNLTIQQVQTVDEVFEILKHSQDENFQPFIFNISESFENFQEIDLQNFDKAFTKPFLVVIQSSIDGSFKVIWKLQEIFTLNIFDCIDSNDLSDLCLFIIEFLFNCIKNNHSGVIQNEKINLSSLTNTNGLNLFFIAAQSGNTKIIKILLHVAFNVDFKSPGNESIAADYAYENYHFETLLELLKASSRFPVNFEINQTSEEVQEFAKLSQNLHEFIKLGNSEKVQEILNQNSSLRYFYDPNNVSAVAAAVINKQIFIYELLIVQNRFFGPHENEEEIFKTLNSQEQEEIRLIHFKFKKDLQPKHINLLISKSFVGHDVDEINSKIEKIAKSFRILNRFKSIEILLKIAALLNAVHIVFDFNRDSVNYLDPSRSKYELGLFYETGVIYIGAKQLLDFDNLNKVLGTIAHEICHFVLFVVFENYAKPYEIYDLETAEEFERISRECESKKEVEDIVGIVFDLYEPEFHHAELITRVPHILAHYFAYPDEIDYLREEFKSLFDFYEIKLLPKLEKALIEIETKDEREIKRQIHKRDKKISKLKKISFFVAISLAIIVGLVVGIIFYEPNHNFNDLNNEQKEKVLNGIVKFEGIEMKFNELFNKTDSNVFNILNSQQIKVLLKGEILNLNESQNEFLESEIYLIYSNMTKELKVKIENSLINFQGFIVNFNSLVENETKIYETLNSKEIFEILKVKTILEVGQKLKNETNFYVNRIFSLNVKNLKQSRIVNKNSSELFLKTQNEKIILLSDNAGNGKSTTFKILALEMKIKFPLKWIQYVNMRNFIEIYENFNFDIFKVLIKIFDIKTLLEKSVLEKILKDSNFVIFWDGFDEISPIYTEKSLKIMQIIKNDTNAIQFIATRPHYAINITNALNIDTVTKMMPYKRNERDEFLMKYFTYKNLTKIKSKIAANYSIKLIKKIQSEERGFVGSPLLLSMIAKVSLTNVDLKNQPKNFYEIYEYFTKINLEMTVSKGNVMEEIKNGFLRSRDINLLKFHQYNAFKFLFPNLNEKYKQLEIFKRYEKVPKSNVTILAHFCLVAVDIGGNVEFIHRTFAEFFVFQYFVDNFYEFEGDASQKEKTFRLDLMIEKLIESDYEELTKFSKSYLKTSKFMFEGKIFKIFGKSMQKRIASGFEEFFNSVDEYDEFFRFGKSLWNFNENLSYFNVIAIKSPFDYPSNFNKYLKQVQKKFPYDKKQQDLILYGKNLRGNFLLAAFREHLEYRDDFNMKEFLIKTKVNSNKGTQIIVNDFKKFEKFSDFYYFIKPILTIDERKRIFTDGLFEFFHNETQIVGIFDELKDLFNEEEIKNYFCTQIENLNLNLDETKLEPEHLDKIDLMFEKCGTIQKTDEFLYSRKDSNFCSRINFYNSSNLIQFYAIWNYVGKNFKNKQKKLLREPVSYLEGGCSSFHFFSRVFFTAEDSQIFLEVIKIYKENFNQNEIKEFCVETMYDIAVIPQYPHKEENVKIFVDLIHEFELEKEEKIQQYLIKFCTRLRIRKQEPLNGNYPLIVLLKQIIGENKFNELQKPRTVCEVKN